MLHVKSKEILKGKFGFEILKIHIQITMYMNNEILTFTVMDTNVTLSQNVVFCDNEKGT